MRWLTRKIMTTALALCLCISFASQAEGLQLPSGLTAIGAEAFYGNPTIRQVVVPSTVRSIGERAFAGCKNLEMIRIPGSVTQLGGEIVSGSREDVLICSDPGSAACDYALKNHIDCQCGTTYRALLVSETYPDIDDLRLVGPENDVDAMKTCLESFPGTPYQITVRRNLPAADILSEITAAFDRAKPQDVSLFYFSGHGAYTDDDSLRGALLGNDGYSCATANQLRAVMDRIPGKKIIIVDACYSGNLMRIQAAPNHRDAELSSSEEATEHFAGTFMSAFQSKSRANFTGGDYFILTSAADWQLCYEELFDGKNHGVFTASLLRGLGYAGNPVRADANANDVVTFKEAYKYTKRAMVTAGQTVQAYPEDAGWFGIARVKALEN